jgi:hypothetical protein
VDTSIRTMLSCRTRSDISHCQRVLNRLQFLIGFLALLGGMAIYIIDRPAHQVEFLTVLPIWLHGYQLRVLPSVISGSLPTFLHAMSFSTITAALCAPSPSAYARICSIWLAVDVVFELAQGPGRWITEWMPPWVDNLPYLHLRQYFLGHVRRIRSICCCIGLGCCLRGVDVNS